MAFLRTRYGSWTLLGLAACLWIAVIFFAWTIEGEKDTLASSQTSAKAREEQQSRTTQLQSLVRETKDARAQLDALAHVDVVSMVDAIDMVGKDAGVYIQIGQAVPEAAKNSSVHAVNFGVSADGSFAALLRAVALLQTLPIPASFEQVQFSYTGGESTPGTSASWHMSARIRILSTADISS